MNRYFVEEIDKKSKGSGVRTLNRTSIAFSLLAFIALIFVSQPAFAESLNVELLYGAHVDVPVDWKDLGSAVPLQEKSLMTKKMKEIALAEKAPELPLISLGAKSGSPPAMITIMFNECPAGDCPDSDYFEDMLKNLDEVKRNEKIEQDKADELNAASGHKIIRHFATEIKKECDAYTMAGGQEVSMYQQLDYVSKVKVLYVGNRILGISIGYGSSDKENGEVAENAFASFGCD